MSTLQIILAVISSSVLSSILISFINWKIHNSNYKKDYYKKILDKRLDAYESLNSLIKKLSNHTILDNCIIHTIFLDDEFFLDFFIQLVKTIDFSFWLNHKTNSKLTELNVFIYNNIHSKISNNLSTEEKNRLYNELGEKHYDEIKIFKSYLVNRMNLDLINLYNVENFFEDSKKESKEFPVYK